jgi:hypothetical protein
MKGFLELWVLKLKKLGLDPDEIRIKLDQIKWNEMTK